jgi:uncharacterized protein with PQ loop repeat
MFHKPRLIKIYTNREYVYLLRSIFLMIAAYFATEIYEILQNGFIIKHGNTYSRSDGPISFWTGVIYHFALMVANIYFIFVFRIGKDGKPNHDDVVVKDDSTKTE